jgi:hypothetical protein
MWSKQHNGKVTHVVRRKIMKVKTQVKAGYAFNIGVGNVTVGQNTGVGVEVGNITLNL